MHILVIGAAGMIGRKLTNALVEEDQIAGKAIERLTLVDIVAASAPQTSAAVDCLALDLSAPDAVKTIVDRRPDLIFHLAAIVSGEAESDFEKGYCVNQVAEAALLSLDDHIEEDVDEEVTEQLDSVGSQAGLTKSVVVWPFSGDNKCPHHLRTKLNDNRHREILQQYKRFWVHHA